LLLSLFPSCLLSFLLILLPDDDQIYADLQNPDKNPNVKEGDDELPGAGNFYCVICSRYFISAHSLEGHEASKLHKRRVKMMAKGEVYMGPESRVDNGKPIVREGQEGAMDVSQATAMQ
tara:strand:- start:50 stop:406 length:357 start_codon:yes stop_codon:yes gene_type:complete